jgi:hypothetical protein
MALLAAPGLGILISELTLGEQIGVSLTGGAILTGVGIRLATRPGLPLPAVKPPLSP